jgi:hypothetical protein
MQDPSNSPPSAGDTEPSVFSPTRPPDQQGASQRSRNKRRKDRGSKSEDEAISKSSSDIQDSGSVLNTPREVNASAVAPAEDTNSPSSSMEDEYVRTGDLFNMWDITGIPQEEIEFVPEEPNTPTLNNGTVLDDSMTPGESCLGTIEPLVPAISGMVNRYKELSRRSKLQGRIQNTKNQILNTASLWASSLKARGEALDRNTSTNMFPDPGEVEDIGSNPSPYDEPSPAILIIQLLQQALREIGMHYPLFMNTQIAVTEISATFRQFGMSTYEGVVRHSQNTHSMHMFFKRLWGV